MKPFKNGQTVWIVQFWLAEPIPVCRLTEAVFERRAREILYCRIKQARPGLALGQPLPFKAKQVHGTVEAARTSLDAQIVAAMAMLAKFRATLFH